MPSLHIAQGLFRLSDTKTLKIANLDIASGESWAFVGANGSGKSALAQALNNELVRLNGSYQCSFNPCLRLSFEQLQKLVTEEWQRNNTDLLASDEHEAGRTTAQIIQEEVDNPGLCQQLASQFAISSLLPRQFKHLSSGETRKALLCRVLMSQPQLIILDEPFDGLDSSSRIQLNQLLAQLVTQGYTLVIIVNRFDELPDFIQNVGILADCTLAKYGRYQQMLNDALVTQLMHSEKIKQLSLILPKEDNRQAPKLPADQPLIMLRNITISYNDKIIINSLTWQVNRGEHWLIVGPNGAGKSTLLSVISGDHPQGYSNDVTLFGRRRGSGETIWDIKRHIGYVSNSLHLEYRVNSSVRNVIASGFFDSIGLYQSLCDQQKKLTSDWLTLLGLNNALADSPFHSLSWGQQRLVLIVRALVKHPTLLILDEPLQGLDTLNRQLVQRFIDILIAKGNTQLLFVSHHIADAPKCLTHCLTFVPSDQGNYTYQYDLLK